MLVNDIIFYFGLVHLVAYALLGLSVLLTYTGEKIIKRAGILKVMLHAYSLYLKNKSLEARGLEIRSKNDD